MSDVRELTPLAALVGIVLAVAVIGSASSESFQRTVATALITLIVVVALYLFTGNSGVLSFGHVAFMAIGAYTTALIRIPPGLKEVTLPNLPGLIADVHVGPAAAVVIGGLAAALFGLIVAGPLVRLNGIAAAIATLSVLIIVNVVIANWDNVTNGTQTMVGVPVTATLWNIVPWVIGALVVAFVFQQSTSGSRLKATREDLVAASAVGVRVAAERGKALVLSAFCAGAAGALYAQFLGAFGPGQFYLDLTFLTIAMLVIGGMRSLSGAVIGTLAVSAVSEVLREIQGDGLTIVGVTLHTKQGLREVILAALMLLVLLGRPQGITGGREIAWPARWRRGR